ncbi:MAG: DNA recombination protein RmuC [Christensenellales bacterium]
MTDILLIIAVVFCACALAASLAALKGLSDLRRENERAAKNTEHLFALNDEKFSAVRRELNDSLRLFGEMISSNQRSSQEAVSQKLNDMERNMASLQEASGRSTQAVLRQLEERLKTFSLENEQRLDNIRTSVSRHLTSLQEDNNARLEKMQGIVDEKLQKTLEERMARSFTLVNERLEQVYKGLGEMQTLATGVGDLKKVLSNVKTRGILGEIQLGSILEEILSPDQYIREAPIKRGTKVEFAVKLPSDDGDGVLMPIDSKFPMDVYSRVTEAYDSADRDRIKSASAELVQSLKAMARDINQKYIEPPKTTAFAVMFLPTEGLYAEAVKLGMIETLQRDYKVCMAGPSTLAALLNSLQMGYQSYMIHKRSGEVWQILSEVKTEFDKFADGLAVTQERMAQVSNDLDTLIGVRTRQMQRKLRKVTDSSEMELLAPNSVSDRGGVA